MSVKFTSIPPKQLSQSILSTDASFKPEDILGWDKVALTASDLGTRAFGAFISSDRTEMEIFEWDPSTVANTSITILYRGLKFDGTQLTEVAANKKDWTSGSTEIQLGADVPQLLELLVDTVSAQTIAGVKTFSSAPISSVAATAANELVRKTELDAAVLGDITLTPVVVPGNGGETLAIDQSVYLNTTDGEWYLLDADTASKSENVIRGITRGAGTDGGAITGGVTVGGVHEADSAIFTANTKYFASDTAGSFGTTAGTLEVTLGFAHTTTKFYLSPAFDQTITEDQQDAMGGTSGIPSDTNKYVTADDVATDGTTDKIVRLDGTSYPAGDASNLTGKGVDYQEFTTDGTWTKPSGAKVVEVYAIGAGGGGHGAKNRNDNETAAGAGGAWVRKTYDANALGATETITVGEGGEGGNTGNSGVPVAGGDSSFGSFITSRGGGAGGAAAGAKWNGDSYDGGSSGVDTSTDYSPRGGGNGGSLNGSAGGGFITNYINAGGSGGAGCTSNGCTGGTGGSPSATDLGLFIGGPGGGGGGGVNPTSGSATPGPGGNGGYPGGGGGGGGECTDGGGGGCTNADGGAGADGAVVVITYS